MVLKSNRFWLVVLGVLLALSALAAWFIATRTVPAAQEEIGPVAVITLDGQEVERIDLGAVTGEYTLSYTGKSGITNVVEVKPGKIRVREATCPDQICVYQGWITESVMPIVCLPNSLIISIASGESEVDGLA